MLTLSWATVVYADAGNPIQGSITQTSTFTATTVTVSVKGQWNWLSHGSDCNYDRAATGAGIIWNDLNSPTYGQAGGTTRGNNEVQKITLSGTVTNATYKLTFKNPAGTQTTSATINAADTAAQLQAKLEAMASIGAGNVAVTGGSGTTPYNIEFKGTLAKTNVNAMTAGNKSGGLTVTIATPTAGSAAVYNGYLVENGAISVYVGTSAASTAGAVTNPQDRMVHPVDLGNFPAGYRTAGTDYPAGQVLGDPVSNDPNLFAQWKGGCGRQPLSAINSKAPGGGPNCPSGLVKGVLTSCVGQPWGSWGYMNTGNAFAFTHTYKRTLPDGSSGLPDQICVNFYDVHGGGTTAPAFQAVKNASEITVDGNGDNSVDTNAFNVTDGANCIKLTPPATPAIVTNAGDANLTGATVNITDTATLSGSNPGADIGDIVFKAYSNAACTTQVGSTQTITAVTGDGVYGPVSVSVGAAGTYYWQASFISSNTGTGGNADAIGVCGDLTPPNDERSLVTQPHIVIEKSAVSGTVNAGDPISFDMVVYNTGNGSATSVKLNDPLPLKPGLDWSIASQGAGWAGTCTITGNAPNQETLDCGGAAGLTMSTANSTAANTTFTVRVTSGTTAATGGDCTPGNGKIDNEGDASSDGNNDDDDASICVQAPGIQVAKDADQASVNAGDTIGFKITVYNTGAGTGTNTKLNDPLPNNPGLNWSIDTVNFPPGAGWAGTCLIDGVAPAQQTLKCGGANGVSVAPVTQANSTFTVHVTSGTDKTTAASGGACDANNPGNVDNTGFVTTSNDGNPNDDATVCVKPADIQTVKTADADSVSAGDTIGFKMTVYNLGTGTGYGVKLNDPLPNNPGLNWQIDTIITPPGAGWAGTCLIDGVAPAQQTLKCGGASGVSVAPISQILSSFTVHVTSVTDKTTAASGGACDVNNPGNVDNVGFVTSTNDGNPQDDATVCVEPAEIQVVKTADDASVNAGDTIGFKITVYNSGTGTAANTKLNDPLPNNPGLNWQIDTIITPPGAGWAGTCLIDGVAPAQQTLKCGGANGLSVAPVTQANSTFTVHVTSVTDKTTAASGGACDVNNPGNVDNVGFVTTSNDGNPNDDATVCVQAADIKIHKYADDATVNAGEDIGFTITVWNEGAGAATGVTLTDTVPTNAGLAWSVDSQGAGWAGTCDISALGVLTCGFPGGKTVPAGGTEAGSSFKVHITSHTTSATAGTCPGTGDVTNTGYVDTTNDGNANDADTTCVKQAIIHIEKTADDPIVMRGNTIGFTIVVWNSGQGDATGVTLTDTLPTDAGLSWTIAGQGTGWDGALTDCKITAGVLSCGGAAGVTVPAGTTQGGSTFTVHITSDTTLATVADSPVVNVAFVHTGNDGQDDDDAQVIVVSTAMTVKDKLVGLPAGATGSVTYTAYHTDTDCGAKTNGVAAGGGPIVGGVVPFSDEFVVGPPGSSFGPIVFFRATYTDGPITFTTACNEVASAP